MNIEEILQKLKSGGQITIRERELIFHVLDSSRNSEELEMAIRAFGLANEPTKENISALEKFLSSNSDIVLSGTFKVLCDRSYWGLTKNYLPNLLIILTKENAFDLSETQIIALSVLGEYLNETQDVSVFRVLFDMLSTELLEYEQNNDYFLKARLERLYHCLDVAIRGRLAELEFRVGRMKIPDDFDNKVLQKVLLIIKPSSSGGL